MAALKIDFLQESLSNLRAVVDALSNPQKTPSPPGLMRLVKKVLSNPRGQGAVQ